MDSHATTVGDVARLTGVSAPTVRRAAQSEGIVPMETAGGHRRFTSHQVERLVRRLGFTPAVDGLTRHQVQALAAFTTHPFGFRSVRAMARAAGLSPTAAGRAVDVLIERGLVDTEVDTVAEGSAREVRSWRLHIGEPWFQIASQASRTVLPRSRPAPTSPATIPRRFWHLFWDVDPSTLTLADHGDYIATRLVLGSDLIARSWALRNLPRRALEHAATNRGADASMRALIHNAITA